MLPVSLDCPFSLPLRYSLTCICPVSCVPYVASFSGCTFLIVPSVFSNISLCCVLSTLCCQFLWIVHFWLPLRYSLTFLCAVSYLPYVASFSGLSLWIASNIYFSQTILYCQNVSFSTTNKLMTNFVIIIPSLPRVQNIKD